MRSKLVSFLFVLLATFTSETIASGLYAIPVDVSSETELRDWGSSQLGGATFQKIKIGDKELLAILIDSGSGVSRMGAYVYVREASSWKLLLVRLTNSWTLELVADSDQKNLVLRSKQGQVYATIPVATLGAGFMPPRD